ncbi:peptidase M48 [Erythrobacteraceae bacterium CFH 75059]|uniref:M48 family metalloprotease n=1 Tax=Qipengyuania thermophila TaxID=2509361 RepID=UPI001022487D|nr:M48 family metalloprotease [Qipengyuania thermophila]TCD06644.1 peptidase M48 [Erythrobacteraceae bacterium CFH 75059]
MNRIPTALRLLAAAFASLALLMLTARPVLAQSILRDTETEALLNDMAAPLVKAAGLEPGNVQIVLVANPSINAFVAGGQIIYIHSGLIEAADTANEVQGVIAHELGHITGGHINRLHEGMGNAARVSLLSLLLGVAAAAAGAGEVAPGIMMAGQRAAIGSFLAFSRVQEASADAAGAQYLSAAGISGRGSLSFFRKLQGELSMRGYRRNDETEFLQTHPLSVDRIQRLRETYVADPAWDAPDDPRLQARFEAVKAKLAGYLGQPEQILRAYPPSDTSVAAHYARAYAFHKDARIEQALAETRALLAKEPDNPYFLELKGQVLLESGRPREAIAPLREATRLTGNAPLIGSIYGHALIAAEDPAYHEEALRVLRASVARDRANAFAWHQLGVIYAQQGDQARAMLASAEQQALRRDHAAALRNARGAEAGLPVGSPDWLRAQDIGMAAQAALERERSRPRR